MTVLTMVFELILATAPALPVKPYVGLGLDEMQQFSGAHDAEHSGLAYEPF